MRMLNYYINRAGRNLSASRRAVLKRAKVLLSKKARARKRKTQRQPFPPAPLTRAVNEQAVQSQ